MLTDIDECARDPSLCRGGHCVNSIGSYICECLDGHELSSDGKACKGKNIQYTFFLIVFVFFDLIIQFYLIMRTIHFQKKSIVLIVMY